MRSCLQAMAASCLLGAGFALAALSVYLLCARHWALGGWLLGGAFASTLAAGVVAGWGPRRRRRGRRNS